MVLSFDTLAQAHPVKLRAPVQIFYEGPNIFTYTYK